MSYRTVRKDLTTTFRHQNRQEFIAIKNISVPFFFAVHAGNLQESGSHLAASYGLSTLLVIEMSPLIVFFNVSGMRGQALPWLFPGDVLKACNCLWQRQSAPFEGRNVQHMTES